MGFREFIRRWRHLREEGARERSDALWHQHVRQGAEARSRLRGAH